MKQIKVEFIQSNECKDVLINDRHGKISPIFRGGHFGFFKTNSIGTNMGERDEGKLILGKWSNFDMWILGLPFLQK